MENENVLIAYHESARVLFAYLNGFACDSIELPGKDGSTKSQLNAGSELPFVQSVLSGNPSGASQQNLKPLIEVARKLMTIYCAGTCAEIFFQNDFAVPEELELDIDGQDLIMIEKIQTFLKKINVEQIGDLPSKTLSSVFKQLKDPGIWKAIESLASKVLEQHDKKLNRFHIEDTLLTAGITIKKSTAKAGFTLGVHEDNADENVREQAKSASFEIENLTPLDIVVRDFLKKIKDDWQQEELNAAIKYLHNVYNKYGRSGG